MGRLPSRRSTFKSGSLRFQSHFQPDIVVIGFQEIVSLEPSTIVFGLNSFAIKKWVNIVRGTLKVTYPEDDYHLIESEELVGCFIICFAKANVAKHIKGVAKSKLKLGLGGNVGNKGATSIRFEICGESFVFLNAHLVDGRSHSDALKRASQFEYVYNNAFINERNTYQNSYCIKNHKNIFFFGDLNFRIHLDKLQGPTSYQHC